MDVVAEDGFENWVYPHGEGLATDWGGVCGYPKQLRGGYLKLYLLQDVSDQWKAWLSKTDFLPTCHVPDTYEHLPFPVAVLEGGNGVGNKRHVAVMVVKWREGVAISHNFWRVRRYI